MGKKKTVSLNTEQRAELEKECRKAKSHTFRQHYQMILPEAGNRTSLEMKED